VTAAAIGLGHIAQHLLDMQAATSKTWFATLIALNTSTHCDDLL
jgi:hypothetical protein